MTEPNKLSAYTNILSVDERKETSGQTKNDEDGSFSPVEHSLGWFIRVSESSAVSVGMDKPPAAFKPGARIKLSIELAPEAMVTTERVTTVPPSEPAKAVAAALEKASAGSEAFAVAGAKADEYRK